MGWVKNHGDKVGQLFDSGQHVNIPHPLVVEDLVPIGSAAMSAQVNLIRRQAKAANLNKGIDSEAKPEPGLCAIEHAWRRQQVEFRHIIRLYYFDLGLSEPAAWYASLPFAQIKDRRFDFAGNSQVPAQFLGQIDDDLLCH